MYICMYISKTHTDQQIGRVFRLIARPLKNIKGNLRYYRCNLHHHIWGQQRND